MALLEQDLFGEVLPSGNSPFVPAAAVAPAVRPAQVRSVRPVVPAASATKPAAAFAPVAAATATAPAPAPANSLRSIQAEEERKTRQVGHLVLSCLSFKKQFFFF